MENEWNKNSVNLSFKYVSGVEVESWIMNPTYKTCKNHESLC